GVAANLRAILDERWAEVSKIRNTQHFIDNYFPHLWKDPTLAARLFSKRPLQGPKTFTRHRTLPAFKDGLAMGLEPLTTNPVDMTLLKVHEMDRYIMAQKTFKDLKKRKLAHFVRSGKPAPQGWSRIDDPIARVQHYNPHAKGLVLRGEWWAPDDVARVLNNYLSPGLTNKPLIGPVISAYRVAGNALNQAQLGMSAFHMMNTTMDSLISSMALGLNKLSRGNIGGFVDVGKAFSPTTPIIQYMRGSKMLKEYYSPGSQGAHIAAAVDALILAGGRVRMDQFYKTGAAASFMKALRRGNYIGASLRLLPAAMEKLAAPIMEHLVPRQKLGVFYELAKMELEHFARYKPNASPDELGAVMAKAWDSVDNRLGELVNDNLFWNKA
ncbi:MAG: hypothetical protein L0Z53_19445, partial [Acidobacteriales bacterium]|nr:hypothetical protein [Terriglobales bacterium]